jgi:hypothetical protein
MRQIILIFLAFIFSYSSCFADYTPTELFVIDWGEGRSELKASPSFSDVDPGTPEDSTDDYFVTGEGPNNAFVDNAGILIFTSGFSQLKGFTDTGELLFDFSGDSPDFKTGMYRGDIEDIFVDAEKRIYITTVLTFLIGLTTAGLCSVPLTGGG